MQTRHQSVRRGHQSIRKAVLERMGKEQAIMNTGYGGGAVSERRDGIVMIQGLLTGCHGEDGRSRVDKSACRGLTFMSPASSTDLAIWLSKSAFLSEASSSALAIWLLKSAFWPALSSASLSKAA